MKKQILLTFIGLSLAAVSAKAQGAYIRAGAGFGIMATNDLTGLVIEKDSVGKITSRANLYGTSGQGPTVRLAGGYMFNKHFGLEMEFYGMFGMYHKISETNSPDVSNITRERSGQFRAVPALLLDAGLEKISPYARFGVLIPLAGKTRQYQIIEDQGAGTHTEYIVDAFGAFSVGFEATAGVAFKLSPNFSINAEIYYSGLRIKSDKATVVKNEQTDMDGNLLLDYLDGAPVFATQIEFVDKLDENSNTIQIPAAIPNLDMDKPLNLLAIRGNYSSFGLTVGIRYVFSKKTE